MRILEVTFIIAVQDQATKGLENLGVHSEFVEPKPEDLLYTEGSIDLSLVETVRRVIEADGKVRDGWCIVEYGGVPMALATSYEYIRDAWKNFVAMGALHIAN